MGKKINRSKILIVVLVALLAISLGYIAWTEFQGAQNQQLVAIYQSGYSQGVTDAVTTLAQQTNNCQPTIINVGNQSRQLIDTACIQLPEQ